MKKFAAALAVAVLVAFAAPAFAVTNPFMDVPMNHWAYDAIGQLAARGVLSGYPDGTYKGKQPTTRYEMASALARALAVVDMTKASKQDVEMLKKLVVEFKDELDALGVKVDQLDKRVALIESRLGGWKMSGSMRVDLYDVDNDAGWAGAAMPRTRFEIQRWFGEDEGMHLYVRLTDGQYSTGKPDKGVRFDKFYVEVPTWWDTTLTVGRFAWDMEADYYLNGNTGFGGNMGMGQDSWLTDRTVDGFGIRKSFGMGQFSAYVAHPYNGWMDSDYEYGMWEIFMMAQLQFTENFAFDIGAQYFAGDDTSEVWNAAGDAAFKLDNLWTAFAGLRFNFNENIALKGLYYYQDSDSEHFTTGTGWLDDNTDNRSAYRIIVDVKQDMLKFTSLWLEYDHLESGFVLPTGAAALYWADEDLWTNDNATPSRLVYDTDIWRVALEQKWNDKWTTFEYVAGHTWSDYYMGGGDADMFQWALGVLYQYNPNVQFGLMYSQLNFDDDMDINKDPSTLRFRTYISF